MFIINETPAGVGKKIYLPLFLQKTSSSKRICGFLDTGADLNVVSLSFLKKIFNDQEIKDLKRPAQIELSSFSNHAIQVLYSIALPLSFTQDGESLEFTFFVVKDIEDSPTFLLGTDFMRNSAMSVGFCGDKNNPYPEITTQLPNKAYVPCYYVSESERWSAKTHVSLSPHSRKICRFYLHDSTECLPADIILLDNFETSCGISIISTRSKIVEHDGKLAAYALCENLKNEDFVGEVTANVELINEDRCIPVNKLNKSKLANINVLYKVNQYHDNVSLPTVNVLEPIVDIDHHFRVPKCVYNVKYKSGPKDPNVDIDKIADSYISPEEKKKFLDPNETAILEPSYLDDENVDVHPDIQLPNGHEIIDNSYVKTAEEIVQVQNFEPHIQEHIQRIFIDKHPNVLARHALDTGNLSRSMGYLKINLKQGVTLPKHKKVYFLAPSASQHMKDILEFLIREDVIEKAPMDEKNDADLFASPAYLLPKSKPESNARLIIDLRGLNSLIQTDPSILPDISTTLHKLRNLACFTCIDLANAYSSMKLDEKCRYLTNFTTPFGVYRYKSLPLGLKSACNQFNNIANSLVHMEPVYENGKLVYEAKDKVLLKESVIDNCFIYFDDLILGTSPERTFQETIEKHFKILEKVIQRISFHGGKISFAKSSFAKFRISFLGWFISNNFLLANPQRVEKMLNAPFPQTRKGVRSIIGLINSIRMCLGGTDLSDIHVLSPLTSSTQKFEVEEKHLRAFERIKAKLCSRPIFARILDPSAPKILFVDASAAEDSSYSCVLCQLTNVQDLEKYVPDYINLDDAVHRLIYSSKLKYEPAPIFFNESEYLTFKKKLEGTCPPPYEYLEKPFMEFDEDNVDQSFFISLNSLQYIMNCKIIPHSELRFLALKQLNSTFLRVRFESNFANKHEAKMFLEDFKSKGPPDKDLILIEALAFKLCRPIVILSSLPKDQENPIIRFNCQLEKPHFVFGLYENKGKMIFRPFYVNKNNYFDLKRFKDRFEIVAYHTRKLPVQKRTRAVLDQELFSLLSSLESMTKYIGDNDTTILTDSKPLYYLFHQDVHRSAVRLARWAQKLKCDYSHVKLQFLPSSQNIADFLSKNFTIAPLDISRLSLPNIRVEDLSEIAPSDRTFTIEEWETVVRRNPNFLKIINIRHNKLYSSLVCNLSKSLKNLSKQLKPFGVLEKRMSHENIQLEQKKEFSDLYQQCISSPNFTFHDDDGQTFKIMNGLIYELVNDLPKVILPTSLIGLFVTYYHLSVGHGGAKKMFAALDPFTFKNKSSIIYNFIARCYTCMLNNKGTRRNALGYYPIASAAMEVVHLDLAESIGKSGLYEHLLIVVCGLTDFTLVFPIKNKTGEEISHIFMYSILQYFNIKYVLADNGPAFRKHEFAFMLNSLNIQKVTLNAYSPQSKGLVESHVKMVKNILKKMLTVHEDDDYQGLPFLVSRIINSTVCSKTNYTPLQAVFGPNAANSDMPFESFKLPNLHPAVLPFKAQLHKKQIALDSMIDEIRTNIAEQKQKLLESNNKNKIRKNFNRGDIVFLQDFSIKDGKTRPLKSKFSPIPHIVLEVYPVSCLIKKLATGYTQIYSNDHLKKYDRLDPSFSILPPEVTDIIKGPRDLDELDIQTLQRFDDFSLPKGIPLMNIDDLKNPKVTNPIDDETEADKILTETIAIDSHHNTDNINESADEILEIGDAINDSQQMSGSNDSNDTANDAINDSNINENLPTLTSNTDVVDEIQLAPDNSLDIPVVTNTLPHPSDVLPPEAIENNDSDESESDDDENMKLRSGRKVHFQ